MTNASATGLKHLNVDRSKIKGTHTCTSHLVESDDEVNPGPQGVQEAAPADGATKPEAHGAHADWLVLPEKRPALQGRGWVEPRGQSLPTVQGLQTATVLYPVKPLYDPAGQGTGALSGLGQ